MVIKNPKIDHGESAGAVGDFIGAGRDAEAQAAPEELYSWSGPSQYDIGNQRKEAMKQKAVSFDSGEKGVGGNRMDAATGQRAQQASQDELGNYYKDVISGRADTAGSRQLKEGGDRALAAQLAAAHQVKGAGMGTARYNAAQMGAAAQAQANQAAGVMRAGEQAQAMGGYGTMLNQQQMGNIAAYQAMQQSDQFRASEAAKQQHLNQQLGLGYTGAGINAGQGQLQGGIAQGQNYMTAQGLGNAQDQANQAQNTQLAGAGMSAAAMMMMASDMRLKENIEPAGGASGYSLPRQGGNYGVQPGDNSGGGSKGFSGWQPPSGASLASKPRIMPGTVSPGSPGSFMQDQGSLSSLGSPGPNANPTLPSSLTTQRARTSRQLPNQATPPLMQGSPVGSGIASPHPTQSDIASFGGGPDSLRSSLAARAPMNTMMSDPLTKMDIEPAGGQSASALQSQVNQSEIQAGVIPAQQSGDNTSIGKSMMAGFQAGKKAADGKEAAALEASKAAADRHEAEQAAKAVPPAPVAPVQPVVQPVQPIVQPVATMQPMANVVPMGAFAAPQPTIASDRRIKDVQVPGGHTPSDEFLEALTRSASMYSYKNPGDEPTDTPTGGKYLGVMAQEVEKTPTGETLVKDGPKGKYLEMGPSLSAALAGLGRLNERLDTIEGAIGAKKKSSKKDKK